MDIANLQRVKCNYSSRSPVFFSLSAAFEIIALVHCLLLRNCFICTIAYKAVCHQHNQHILIRCSFHQDIPHSCDQSVVTVG